MPRTRWAGAQNCRSGADIDATIEASVAARRGFGRLPSVLIFPKGVALALACAAVVCVAQVVSGDEGGGTALRLGIALVCSIAAVAIWRTDA